MNQFSKTYGKVDEIWELKKSVYGVPDAGNEWSLERDHILIKKMGMKRSSVDQCLYWKIGHIGDKGEFTERHRHTRQRDVR